MPIQSVLGVPLRCCGADLYFSGFHELNRDSDDEPRRAMLYFNCVACGSVTFEIPYEDIRLAIDDVVAQQCSLPEA